MSLAIIKHKSKELRILGVELANESFDVLLGIGATLVELFDNRSSITSTAGLDQKMPE